MIATHVVLARRRLPASSCTTQSQCGHLSRHALYGLGGDIFAATRSALLKSMLPDDLLGEANGVFQSVREGLRIIAPLAGAGIYAAFGGGAVALVDAASFLGSAATLVVLRFKEPPAAVKSQRFLREISLGMTHIAHTRVLREMTIGIAAALLIVGLDETLIFAMAAAMPLGRVRKVATFQGIGAIAGGSSPRVRSSGRRASLAGIGLALFGPATACGSSRSCVRARDGDCRLRPVWAVVALTSYQRALRLRGSRQRRREHAVQRAADHLDAAGAGSSRS